MAVDQQEQQQEKQDPGQHKDQPQGPEKDQQGGDDDAKKKANPRRKRTIRFIILALVVVAAVVAIPVYAYYSVRESTDDAQVAGHLITISPRISGTMIDVLVNDNQPVGAGQELVRLDPADYRVALHQAQAQLVGSQAATTGSQLDVPITTVNTTSQVSTSSTQVQQAQAGIASAQQTVDASRAALESANGALAERQANLVKAQKDLLRMKDLVDKDEISRQDYDAAVAAAEANAAQVSSARADIVEAEHNIGQSLAQLDQARARLATANVQQRQSQQLRATQQAASAARYKQSQATVQQRQADLDQAQLNLQYTIIKAPVDGVVTRKSAEPGMQVSAGQQFMALVPLDDIWVTANFKETQLKKMRVGQRVEITTDTYGSGHKYRAHIDSISAASGALFSLLPPENATGNYVKVVQRIPVKIVLEPGENREHLLVPGMSVNPTVFLNSGTNNAY